MASVTDIDRSRETEFEKVVEAIKSEREYQLRRWGFRQANGVMIEAPHSVNDFLVYMQDYLTETFHEASRKSGNAAALESLRKVVTLGIACFEQHGVPRRKFELTVYNGRDNLPA